MKKLWKFNENKQKLSSNPKRAHHQIGKKEVFRKLIYFDLIFFCKFAPITSCEKTIPISHFYVYSSWRDANVFGTSPTWIDINIDKNVQKNKLEAEKTKLMSQALFKLNIYVKISAKIVI